MKKTLFFLWIVQGLILIVPVTLMAIIMGLGGSGVIHSAATIGITYMILDMGYVFFFAAPLNRRNEKK